MRNLRMNSTFVRVIVRLGSPFRNALALNVTWVSDTEIILLSETATL